MPETSSTIEAGPRYIVGGPVNYPWYPASVFDTQHVRGQSPTRKVIPCASREIARQVAAELNAGIVTVNQ